MVFENRVLKRTFRRKREKNRMGRDHLGELGVDGRIISKYIFKNGI
jgi:hypothetical protein